MSPSSLLRKSISIVSVLIVAVSFPGSLASSQQQHLSRMNRDIADAMLNTVASDLRNNYYDTKLKGIDLDAKVRDAKQAIAQAPTMDVAYLQIAGVLDALNDSHTIFFPPSSTLEVEYGWHYQMIGDRCFVTQVRPGSDAEAKGIKPGDEVLLLEGFTPARDSLHRISYVIGALSPQRSLQVYLRDQSGKIRKLDVLAKTRETKNVTDYQAFDGGDLFRARMMWEEELRREQVVYVESGPDLMIIKLPSFFQSKFDVEGLLDKARTHKTLIMDLRGNPGGAEESLQYWLGGILAKNTKIADRVTRKKSTPVMAKSDQHHLFSGNLIVLMDSNSASCAELFARVVQLEKRGIVLGDRSAGATMEAMDYSHTTGVNPMYEFGARITDAELLMSDGKSLEHLGVTPDELKIPDASDLASNRDPVLSRAAELGGVKLSSDAAGKLFPHEWRKNLPFDF